MIHLYEPTSGTVTFDGVKVDKSMSRKQAHELTGRMQMIFQDPYASLNPRRKIMDIVGEGLDAHGLAKKRKDKEEQVIRLLETVGLQAEHADRFPHEFSGGQRQRVGIARALAVNPDFIVCDEPISALDVSIQAQVVNLLEELQEKRGLTYLFIAHDLSMVKHISDRIGVMYLGYLVELATVKNSLTIRFILILKPYFRRFRFRNLKLRKTERELCWKEHFQALSILGMSANLLHVVRTVQNNVRVHNLH